MRPIPISPFGMSWPTAVKLRSYSFISQRFSPLSPSAFPAEFRLSARAYWLSLSREQRPRSYSCCVFFGQTTNTNGRSTTVL